MYTKSKAYIALKPGVELTPEVRTAFVKVNAQITADERGTLIVYFCHMPNILDFVEGNCAYDLENAVAVHRFLGGLDRSSFYMLHSGDVISARGNWNLNAFSNEREVIQIQDGYSKSATAQRRSPWTRVEDGLPQTDKDDKTATVWAVVIGTPRFKDKPKMLETRFHENLGWQPIGSTGWDWIVTHWMLFPALPPEYDGIA
jgi:hypothetical protein